MLRLLNDQEPKNNEVEKEVKSVFGEMKTLAQEMLQYLHFKKPNSMVVFGSLMMMIEHTYLQLPWQMKRLARDQILEYAASLKMIAKDDDMQ